MVEIKLKANHVVIPKGPHMRGLCRLHLGAAPYAAPTLDRKGMPWLDYYNTRRSHRAPSHTRPIVRLNELNPWGPTASARATSFATAIADPNPSACPTLNEKSSCAPPRRSPRSPPLRRSFRTATP